MCWGLTVTETILLSLSSPSPPITKPMTAANNFYTACAVLDDLHSSIHTKLFFSWQFNTG